jgi:mannose-1-phosphate guanylyltransferase
VKALILAAGRGTRVQPLTHTLPKPMIPIVHKPVMELLVDQLRAHGFDEIVVNTSFLAREIEGYFRDGHRFGVKMAYSFEGFERDGALVDQPVGSAGAMQKIQTHSGFFDDAFVVVCGDAIVDLDLTALLRFHRARGAIATIALKRLPDEQLQHYGVALTDGDGRVREFQEKPAPGTARSNFANTGIYVFDPAIFRHIPRNRVYDIGSELLPALARGGERIFGVELPFQWLDIGRLEDYYRVVMQAMQGEVAWFDLPSHAARPGLWVGPNVDANFNRITVHGPVHIGGSATIGDHAKLIGPVVIGAGAVVESGALIESSVVLDHTRVARHAHVVRKVIGPRFCFCADGTVVDGRVTDTPWLFSDARSRLLPLTPDQLRILSDSRDAAAASVLAAA